MSNRSRSIAGVAALAALLALPLLAGGCIKRITYKDGAIVKIEYIPVNPLDPRGPRDYFARLESKRDAGRAIQVFPMFVFPGPFLVTATAGISDPELLDESEDGIVCIELFEDGFFGDLARTFDLCGRYTNGGYQAFNSENDDFQFYPGVSVVDLQIEYDGTDVTFSSRPQGDPDYDVITTFPFAHDTRLIPSFGGFNFAKKGVADLLTVNWTATPPVDPTPEEACFWHIGESYRHDLWALENLEGATPNLPLAQGYLANSRTELASCRALTDDFFDAKVGKQTFRYLIRADKKLEKAEREVADQNPEGAISPLLKSLQDQGNGFRVGAALDFRDQF
jgi:hypothetical protein